MTIYNRTTGAIVTSGCSYKHDGFLKVNSIHAEQHALMKRPIYGVDTCKCIIVTLTKADNFASCSRPCAACAAALQKKMISVIYAERTNDGGWAIREVPFDLLTEGYLKPTKYA